MIASVELSHLATTTRISISLTLSIATTLPFYPLSPLSPTVPTVRRALRAITHYRIVRMGSKGERSMRTTGLRVNLEVPTKNLLMAARVKRYRRRLDIFTTYLPTMSRGSARKTRISKHRDRERHDTLQPVLALTRPFYRVSLPSSLSAAMVRRRPLPEMWASKNILAWKVIILD